MLEHPARQAAQAVARKKLAALLAMVLAGGFLTVAAPVAQSAPTADDTPVLLTPKGEHESGDDEESFDKLRDAYYWSRLLSGDDQLSLGEAAKLRSTASTRARRPMTRPMTPAAAISRKPPPKNRHAVAEARVKAMVESQGP